MKIVRKFVEACLEESRQTLGSTKTSLDIFGFEILGFF